MGDLIRLLPDSVANQIAAGEVVQRPASAAKELLENTIDAGATDIKLIIKEAGKTLIQVIDNGCGMSERDARMCFERHATSKIQSANDLQAIRTLGFRGEALASIASVAQLELKTKRVEDEIGTCVEIEGSDFKSQSPVNCPNGTSVMVKNLFFNVPARRNFLKSNTLELKYLMEEFFRIALVNPGLSFSFYNQDKILFQLPASNLKQRIINLLGGSYNQRLIPVEQQTELVNISGFIGKPEFAKKTRGEQYFFTNGRFMKNPYLHHAVENAFKELIPSDAFPTYFLYLEVDPKSIDVNIHPTKTEINFLEIKSIYAILHAAIKQSIGKFNLSPTLDFEVEQSMILPDPARNYYVPPPSITINPDFNPFEKKTNTQPQIPFIPTHSEKKPDPQEIELQSAFWRNDSQSDQLSVIQVKNAFLITHTQSGIVIIDQQNAHERILYERMLNQDHHNPGGSQHILLPQSITLPPEDAQLFQESRGLFEEIGFDIRDFGNNTFLIHAVPADCQNIEATDLMESVLESLKVSFRNTKTPDKLNLFRILSKKLSVKKGRKLHPSEMISMVEQLFACKVPEISPDSKPTMMVIPYEEMTKKFKH